MRLLPVTSALGHSIDSTLRNIKFAFHASWPWMLVLLPINIAGNIYLMNLGMGEFNPTKPMKPEFFLVSMAMGLASMVAFASIAVNWHRYILMNEVPVGAERLRLDGLVVRYLGNTLMIVLLTTLIGIGASLPIGILFAIFKSASTGLAITMVVVAAIIGFLLMIGLSIRWSIKLVAVAMGRRDLGIADAWRASSGNHWRIVGLYILVFLVLIFVGAAFGGIAYVLGRTESVAGLSTLITIQMAVNWASTIWNITLLTSLYGFFIESRDF
jgi:hypothetical protein